MGANHIIELEKGFNPVLEESVYDSLFKQYQKVVVDSLVKTFELDFFVKDVHGGDVDTIHNVRQIGKDEKMTYKNKQNQADYENRGAYDSKEYHSHSEYKKVNQEVKVAKAKDELVDGYTGERIAPNEKSDLDHEIAAKEIHDDPGRVLAKIKGSDLANRRSNLIATNPRTNRTKKADSMDEFHRKYGHEYTKEQLARMKREDVKARKAYNREINIGYYTSKEFLVDTRDAALKVGGKMALKQVVGLIFTEIWFAIKKEMEFVIDFTEIKELFRRIGNAIKKAWENIKIKYKDVLSKFKDGFLAGVFSSITTTICNMFFTTTKTLGRLIRDGYSSIIESITVLFCNPENLSFGERMKKVLKILALAASTIAGVVLGEIINKSFLAGLGEIGGLIQRFLSLFITGILSCTFVYFIDRSKMMKKFFDFLDSLDPANKALSYYKKRAEELRAYAVEIFKIDIKELKEKSILYSRVLDEIENISDEYELHKYLNSLYDKLGIAKPYKEESFDKFMMNKESILVYK